MVLDYDGILNNQTSTGLGRRWQGDVDPVSHPLPRNGTDGGNWSASRYSVERKRRSQ